MRFILPTALAAALILPAAAPAAPAHHHDRGRHRHQAHISLHVSKHNLLTGRRLVVTGRVRPGGSHRVRVIVHGPSGGLAGVGTDRHGAFRVEFGLGNGAYRVRAFGVHDSRVTGSTSAARRVTVYRPAAASYYGPGLYGGALACGGTLQPGTLGVANRTLPCGTRVKLRYRGHTVTVPVVDRGPYVGGRDFDLTEATKARLHFPDLGVVLSSR